MSMAQLWWLNEMRKRIEITIIFSSLLILSFVPVRGYALNSVREITYKNVNTVLTKEDIDLRGENYLFSGLTDTLPYTVTEDNLGINNLTIYDGENMRTIKIVVTDASREVDRDGWTKIKASEDTRIVYVSSSKGDNSAGTGQMASAIKTNHPDDESQGPFLKRLTPIMTSSTTPSGKVSASSQAGWRPESYPWKAFSRQMGHRNESWHSANHLPAWLQYRFEKAHVVTGYTIILSNIDRMTPNPPNAAPKTWEFQGSNDGKNWIVLDSVSGQDDWIVGDVRTWTFENDTAYDYYRLHITESNGSAVMITEFEILGYSEEIIPLKSPNMALWQVRNGYADWILLKRGDVWRQYWDQETDGSHWSMRLSYNGRSHKEPLLVATYGAAAERPLLNAGRIGIRGSNTIVAGIHSFSMSVGSSPNTLIENNLLSGAEGNGLTVSSSQNFEMRRNIVANNYRRFTSGHIQGMYASSSNRMLLEENIFYYNGWKENVQNPTMFNHNVYLAQNSLDVRFYRNMVADGSSYGIQNRGGGWLKDNIFVRQPFQLMVGAGWQAGPPGYRVVVEGNVITETISQGGRNPVNGKGIEVANLNPEYDHRVSNNIVFQPESYPNSGRGGHGGITTNSFHQQDEVGQEGLLINGNIIYNWPRSLRLNQYDRNITVSDNFIQLPVVKEDKDYLVNLGADVGEYNLNGNTWYGFDENYGWLRNSSNMDYDEWLQFSGETNSKWRQVEYLDTDRSLARYHSFLSSGNKESYEVFFREALKQSRHNWDWAYSPVRILEYFREGFTVLADPESIKISGPEELEIPVSGEKNQIYAIEIRDENDTVLKDEFFSADIASNPPGVSLSGTRLTVTPQAEPGDVIIEVKLDEDKEIRDEITVTLLYHKTAPDEVLVERSFITPSNPKLKFGEEAKEVLITDVRGNEVFRKEKGTSRFIIWNPGKRGTVSIESGIYIYRVKTKDGYEYGTVVLAK